MITFLLEMLELLNFDHIYNIIWVGEETEAREIKVRPRKRAVKKAQDKRALVQKRTRQMGARQKSANLLGLLGLL